MGRSTGHFSELASMEASSPVLLLRVLDLPSISNPQQLTSLYFTDAETFIDFFDENGNPEAYIPVGLSFDKVTVDNSGSMVSFRVKLDNVSRDFCTLAGSVRVQGAQLQLLRAFREDLSNPDAGQTLISGIIQAWTITEKSIEAEVTSPVALSMRAPQRLYWPKCHWKFKGDLCGFDQNWWWERWWEKTSLDYWTVDPSKTPTIERLSRTVNYTNVNPGGQVNYYNCRILARLVPKYSETYTISIYVSDGLKLWLDGTLKIDQWNTQTATHTCTFSATAGTPVSIQIDHFERTEDEYLQVKWSSASQPLEVIGTTAGTVILPTGKVSLYDYCGRTVDDCLTRNNITHFGGFPHILRSRNPREVWTKS